MFRGCKDDFGLKDVIKIDVPTPMAVKDCDGSIAVNVGYELLSVRRLMHLHGHASIMVVARGLGTHIAPCTCVYCSTFHGYICQIMQVHAQRLFLQEHCR